MPNETPGRGCDYARRIVGDDKTALDALDRALQQPVGVNQHREGVDNVHIQRSSGNSESAALRRLRKDRPDLHAQVLNRELKANTAMVEAGFRPKTFTIRADKPESIVGTLRRQLEPEVLSMVAKLLSEER